MKLKKQIQKDITLALKNQQKQKLSVLRYLSAQLKNKELEKDREELTDEEIITLISGQIKKLEESLKLFKKEKRRDLIEKAEREIKILNTYLPQQISDEELANEVRKIVSKNTQIVNQGALIGICIKALSGKADNKRIAGQVMKIVKS